MDWFSVAVGWFFGCIALAAWGLRLSWFRVHEGHVATLTTFGAAALLPAKHGEGTPQLRTWPPGLHRKRPWQRVLAIRTMERSLELVDDHQGRSAIATDGTVLRLDSIMRFTPRPEALYAFVFGTRHAEQHIAGLFSCFLRSEIANFGTDEAMGSYALICQQRARLNAGLASLCSDGLQERYGLLFRAIDLIDISPPDELADALNALTQAQAAAATLFFRAESVCQQRTLAAERGVRIAEASAQAAEQEMTTLAGFLRQLAEQGSLHLYLARRRQELLAQARTVYWNESAPPLPSAEVAQ